MISQGASACHHAASATCGKMVAGVVEETPIEAEARRVDDFHGLFRVMFFFIFFYHLGFWEIWDMNILKKKGVGNFEMLTFFFSPGDRY